MHTVGGRGHFGGGGVHTAGAPCTLGRDLCAAWGGGRRAAHTAGPCTPGRGAGCACIRVAVHSGGPRAPGVPAHACPCPLVTGAARGRRPAPPGEPRCRGPAPPDPAPSPAVPRPLPARRAQWGAASRLPRRRRRRRSAGGPGRPREGPRWRRSAGCAGGRGARRRRRGGCERGDSGRRPRHGPPGRLLRPGGLRPRQAR